MARDLGDFVRSYQTRCPHYWKLKSAVETDTRVHEWNSNQMFLSPASSLPDMVAHVFIFQAFTPLFFSQNSNL